LARFIDFFKHLLADAWIFRTAGQLADDYYDNPLCLMAKKFLDKHIVSLVQIGMKGALR